MKILFHKNFLLFLFDLNQNRHLLAIFIKIPKIKFYENLSNRREFVSCTDEQTYKQTDMKLISLFAHSFRNRLKPSGRRADVPVQIRTGFLANTSLGRYCCTNILDKIYKLVQRFIDSFKHRSSIPR
jgi:hypothetical protein